MTDTILLDIDGVCNRFQWYVLNLLGLDLHDESWYPVEAGWDIVMAANILAGKEQFTKASFWKSITREMWASVPVSQEFGLLLGMAETLVGKENVFFLTSPTLDPDCLAGKLEWITRSAPGWMHRQFLIGPPKHLCAKPTAVLIDDADKNVNAFREHGGKAILVPRPWNTLHGKDTMLTLRREFFAIDF